MRIHLNGDWAATTSFALASVATALSAYYYNPLISTSLKPYLYGLATCYLVVAVIAGVVAKLGREVPDKSTWVTWRSTGWDLWSVVGSAFLIYAAGAGLLLGIFDPKSIGGINPAMGAIGVVILIAMCWGVTQLNLTAWIVVFTPEKNVITLKGRPFTFVRRTYQQKDWLGLHVSFERGYSGGLYRSAPDNLYFVWGLYPGGAVQLNTITIPKETKRAVALQQLHDMVEETAVKTGLMVPMWPLDKEIYLDLWDNSD